MAKRTVQCFFVALLCVLGTTQAQTTIVLTPNPVLATGPASEPLVNAHMQITNEASESRTYRWERSVIQLTSGCATTVCDPEGCYFTSVSANEFDLSPGETDLLDVDLVNLNALSCCAIVHLKVYEVGNPANENTGIYLINDCASSTNEVLEKAIKLFPNPVQTAFTLEKAAMVKSIRIFSLDGKLQRTFKATPFESYDISDLEPGTFIVVLDDVNALPLTAIELVKN